MLILLPVLLLLVASLAILILRSARPGFGYAWLVAVGGSLLTWLGMFFLRGRLPQSLALSVWQPQNLFRISPALLLDNVSWPFAFALATLALAVILTAIARLDVQISPFAWSGNLALLALGMLSVLAGNLLTLLMTWVAIDLAELCIALIFTVEKEQSQSLVMAFSGRLLGVFFVLWAMIADRAGSAAPSFQSLSPASSLFLLLGAGLRLGVLPLRTPAFPEPSIRRGLGNVLRMVPAASALVLLARLPQGFVPASWKPILLALTALAALYAGAAWLLAADEIQGRSYWLVGVAALAVSCVIQGEAQASLAWSLTLLLAGSLIMLYNLRSIRLIPFIALALWSISGLPYSPAAPGIRALFAGSAWLAGAMMLLAHALLLAGFFRHGLRSGEALPGIERWVSAIYPLGLSILPVALIYLGVAGWPGSLTPGLWWAALISVSIATLIGIWALRAQRKENGERLLPAGWYTPGAVFIVRGINYVFSLSWFYWFLRTLYRGLGLAVGVVADILEGDGGILWVLVLLSLLISLLSQTGGV
jgi:hypothetical protein